MRRVVVAVLLLVLTAWPVAAHITPAVVLVSDREALVGLLSGATRFFVREVRLSGDERRAIRERTQWTPDEDFHRFYIGRDAAGGLVAAAVFLTEFTIHGPVRVAVAMAPDGRIRGARVIELTEETYVWVKPLLDADFTGRFAGHGAGAAAGATPGGDPMTQFYAQVIASLVQRAVVLVDVAVRAPGRAT
jgi:hypothetical protein